MWINLVEICHKGTDTIWSTHDVSLKQEVEKYLLRARGGGRGLKKSLVGLRSLTQRECSCYYWVVHLERSVWEMWCRIFYKMNFQFLFCVYEYISCMYVGAPLLYLCHWRAEDGVWSPGTGVTVTWELLCEFWWLKPGPLEEKYMS